LRRTPTARSAMPTFHRATTLQFKLLTSTSLRDTLRDYRKSPVTRFITDANIEPWALHVMRYKHLDFLDCDSAGIRTFDDHAVFAEAWRLKRLLVTHDSDFLDDRQFPFSRCPGLPVLPTYGRVSLEFGNLLAAATAMICRGREMWFHTKITVGRDFVLRVRTWEKTGGMIASWQYRLPNATKWRDNPSRPRALKPSPAK
jgi:predicted nuclease of predicted toxin-antitoxin system